MKKIFNKNIFKDKSFIKMICFTIVLLLVLVLGNSFGYVSAEGSDPLDFEISGADTFMTYTGWCNSSLYNASFPSTVSSYFPTQSNSYNSQIFSDFITYASSHGSFSGSNYVVCAGNEVSDNMSLTVYTFDSDTYCYFKSGIRFVASGQGHHVSYTTYSYYNGSWSSGINGYEEITRNYEDYNGYTFYSRGGSEFSGAISGRLALANVPIYGANTNKSWDSLWNEVWYLWHYLEGGESYSDYFTDLNYYSADGMVGGSGGASGGSPSNYMYADSADWVLNNYSGNVWSNYNTWSVTFTSNLNDYIRSEIGNLSGSDLSKYYLDFDCYAYVEFYYQGVGQDVSLSSPLYGNFQFDTTTTIPGDGYYWSCTYKTPTDSHANLFKNINAKNFADGGYSKTYGLGTLFKFLSPNGTFGDNSVSITLSDLCSATSSGDLIFDEIKNDWKKFNLVCSAKIYYRNGSEEYESGSYTENFDLLTGDSVIGDSSMLTNYNPYNGNTGEQVQLPSTSTGTSTSTATTGNVTQTVTVTNDGAKYIPSLISKLIPTSLSDTGTGLVSTFSDMAQTNGWISVMASTVPAIPSTIWTYLTNYLGISLYLLACAFVLRLILDLL